MFIYPFSLFHFPTSQRNCVSEGASILTLVTGNNMLLIGELWDLFRKLINGNRVRRKKFFLLRNISISLLVQDIIMIGYLFPSEIRASTFGTMWWVYHWLHKFRDNSKESWKLFSTNWYRWGNGGLMTSLFTST